MLDRATFNLIRASLTALTPEELETFSSLDPAAKLVALRPLVPTEKATDEQIAAFVLVLQAKSGAVDAGSQAHFDLRKGLLPNHPVPMPWHKEKPPTTVWALTDANRSPSWADEAVAHTAITAKLTFDDARSAENIAAAVRAHFGFGGMEDLMDYRCVGPADPTMRLFVEGIHHTLFALRPEWHDAEGNLLAKLPDAVDGRSSTEIEAERAEAARIAHDEARRKREADYREAKLKQYQELKAGVFEIIGSNSKDLVETSKGLSLASFDQAKGNEGDVPNYSSADCFTYVVGHIAEHMVVAPNTTPEEAQKILVDVRAQANQLIDQWMLARLNKLQPTWLRELANGDLKFRPAPLKQVKPAVNKHQKAAVRALYRVVEAYGDAMLLWAVKEIVDNGVVKPRPAYLEAAPVVIMGVDQGSPNGDVTVATTFDSQTGEILSSEVLP